jgi:hypothetical protein
MAQNDDAVILPVTAHICTGTVGTAVKPTLAELETFRSSGWVTTPTGFTDIGHTNIDEIVAFGSDGGDSEVKGSLQNKTLREILTSEAVDYLTVQSLQVKDNTVLSLYYGGGDASVADEFSLPDTPAIQERALLVAIDDPGGVLGLFVYRASVKRDDTISMPSDDFSTVPLRFTYLKATGQPKATWIGAGLGI